MTESQLEKSEPLYVESLYFSPLNSYPENRISFRNWQLLTLSTSSSRGAASAVSRTPGNVRLSGLLSMYRSWNNYATRKITSRRQTASPLRPGAIVRLCGFAEISLPPPLPSQLGR